MTREEEKREAARKYATHDVDTKETDFYGKYVKEEDFVLPEFNAFLAGCKWSDENPKCPWISTKDDLPCNHKKKIHKDCLSTTNVFVLYPDYSLGLNYMRKINNKWIWYNGEPLYWLDIPDYLPIIENEV